MASSSRVTSSSGRQTTRRVFQSVIHSRGASPFVFNVDAHNIKCFADLYMCFVVNVVIVDCEE